MPTILQNGRVACWGVPLCSELRLLLVRVLEALEKAGEGRVGQGITLEEA